MSGVVDHHVFGIGNPLLDISATVDKQFLEKYGLKESDAILCEEKHQPIYKDMVDTHEVHYTAGGAGQNSIRLCQWMLNRPNSTTYVGCVGDDEYGRTLKEEVTKDGVDANYYVQTEKPTGTCAVCITNKERSMVANLSAANEYKKTHFDSEEIQKKVEQAKVFYLSGFFLTVSPETMIAIGEHAVKEGKTVVMNISAPFLVDFFHDQMMSVMKYADIIVANELEAAAFGKKMNFGEDLKEVAKKTAHTEYVGKKDRVVVFTRGKDSSYIYSKTSDDVTEHNVKPIDQEKIVDVNGAGDSFVGGFLSGLAQGQEPREAVRYGQYSAWVIIQTGGVVLPKHAPEYNGEKWD